MQTDGGAQAVAVLDGEVYVGGHQDNVCLTGNGTQGTGGGFTCNGARATPPRPVRLGDPGAAKGRPRWAGPRWRGGCGQVPRRLRRVDQLPSAPRVPPQVVSARYWVKVQRWPIHSEANQRLPPAVTAAL